MTCTWMDDVTGLSHGIQPLAVAWAHHSGIGPNHPCAAFHCEIKEPKQFQNYFVN